MTLRIKITCTILLLFPRIYGHNKNNNNLKAEFIERIYEASDSATVLLVAAAECGFLSDFMKNHNTIPVSISDGTSPFMFHNENSLDNTILVVQSSSENNPLFMMTTLARIIQKLQARKQVIIFASDLVNLAECFSYFWKNKFTRIFGIAGSTVYTYLPFADSPIQIIASNDTQSVDALKDLNGFSVRTMFREDFPRIIRYIDRQGSVQIGGTHGEIFLNFLRKHNGTFKEVERYKNITVRIVDMIDATLSGEIDLAMNLYHPIIGAKNSSYPVDLQTSTFMVPLKGVVGANEYFVRPFSYMTWLCIGSTVVYIILMDVLRDICILSKANFWESFSRIFLMMLRLPTEDKITTAYRFHAQVLLLAFVLGNIYTIYFTSFLTVFIKIRQHESIQDLIDSDLKVLMVKFEWEILNEMKILPVGFEKIVIPVDFYVLAKERDSMRNTSFAYSVGSDKGSFLISLQAVVSKPLFRLLPESLITTFACFLLPDNSPLKEILDRFIMQIVETGLYRKWRSDAVFHVLLSDGIQMNCTSHIRNDVVDQHRSVPLTLYHFKFAWDILLFGLTIAVIVFVGELLLINIFSYIKF